MRRFSFRKAALLFGGFLLLVCAPASALARSYVGGTVYTRDGKVFTAVRFFEPLRKDDFVTGREGDQTVKIPIGEVLELNLLTAEANYVYQHSKFVPQTGIVTLILRSGKTRMLTDAYFGRGTLAYTGPGPDRQQQERQTRFRDIVKIRFEQTTGRVRTCPLDQAVFPDDYLFCPHHGVPLIWREP